MHKTMFSTYRSTLMAFSLTRRMALLLLSLSIFSLFMSQTVIAKPLEIQHWQTSQGMKVMFYPTDALPMLDVRLVFDAGSARDGDLPGLALMTNGLLSEGGKTLSGEAIAKRMDAVGARLGTSSLRDMGIISLRTLTEAKPMAVAMETLLDILAGPAFDPAVFERERNRLLVSLQYDKQSPQTLASQAFYRQLYQSHPYAHPSKGDADSIKKITVSKLRDFYQRYYVAQNAVLAVVGDMTKDEAQSLAETIAATLPQGRAAKPLTTVKQPEQSVQQHIPFDSTQSSVLIGQPVMSRLDKDFYTLYVGNHVLGGGGFTSRILEEIRVKRGLAYSAYSYFAPMQAKGPFTIGFNTKNASLTEALTVARETLDTFIHEGPSEEELTLAKKNITGSFPLKISSNSKIVEYLSMIGFYNLPMDYLDTFNDKINAVTRADIRDAFARRINTDALVTVIVGPETALNGGQPQ